MGNHRIALQLARLVRAVACLCCAVAACACAAEMGTDAATLPLPRHVKDAADPGAAPTLRPTNRIDSSDDGVCAILGPERRVFCWGYFAQFCGPRTCGAQSVELPRCKNALAAWAEEADARCATSPVQRPLAGAVRLSKTGEPVCVGKADGQWSCVYRDYERPDDLIEYEKSYAALTGVVWSNGGLSLLSDGSIRDRIGTSTIVPRKAGTEARKVRIDMRFRRLGCDTFYCCGIGFDDAAVYCWGENTDLSRDDSTGVLGIGQVTLQPCGFLVSQWNSPKPMPEAYYDCTDTPQRVRALPEGARDITVHAYNTCATLESGSVWCWGSIPDGTSAFVAVGEDATVPIGQLAARGNRWANPEPVAGLSRVRTVTLGHDFACALRDDATVWCWGSNDSGNLGDGTRESRLDPRPVSGLPRVTELSAGRDHVCAITEDLALYCWGDNAYGQLGNGTFDNSAIPVQVQPPGTISPIWNP